MTSRLSSDRRVVDEPTAAAFLQAAHFAHYVAHPVALVQRSVIPSSCSSLRARARARSPTNAEELLVPRLTSSSLLSGKPAAIVAKRWGLPSSTTASWASKYAFSSMVQMTGVGARASSGLLDCKLIK